MPSDNEDAALDQNIETRLREAVVRAGYRAILRRDPEHLVTAAFKGSMFSPSFENSLVETISGLLQSREFAGIAGRPQFAHDTWCRR